MTTPRGSADFLNAVGDEPGFLGSLDEGMAFTSARKARIEADEKLRCMGLALAMEDFFQRFPGVTVSLACEREFDDEASYKTYVGLEIRGSQSEPLNERLCGHVGPTRWEYLGDRHPHTYEDFLSHHIKLFDEDRMDRVHQMLCSLSDQVLSADNVEARVRDAFDGSYGLGSREAWKAASERLALEKIAQSPSALSVRPRI